MCYICCFIYRTPRPERTAQSRTIANEDHFISPRPRDVQRRSAKESTLFQPSAGKTTGTEIPECTGSPTHLLSQTGGPGAGSAADRKNVRRQLALLSYFYLFLNRDKKETFYVICTVIVFLPFALLLCR